MIMWQWVSCYNGHVTTVSLGKVESHEEFDTESYCKTLQRISTHSTSDQLQGKWASHDDCDTRFPVFELLKDTRLGKHSTVSFSLSFLCRFFDFCLTLPLQTLPSLMGWQRFIGTSHSKLETGAFFRRDLEKIRIEIHRRALFQKRTDNSKV